MPLVIWENFNLHCSAWLQRWIEMRAGIGSVYDGMTSLSCPLISLADCMTSPIRICDNNSLPLSTYLHKTAKSRMRMSPFLELSGTKLRQFGWQSQHQFCMLHSLRLTTFEILATARENGTQAATWRIILDTGARIGASSKRYVVLSRMHTSYSRVQVPYRATVYKSVW